jgi:hypothetical protein
MKLRTAIATATTAAVLATSGVALAGAAGNTSSSAPTTTVSTPTAAPAAVAPKLPRAARVRIRALIRKGAVAVITQTIGIDRKTFRTDLLAGQTIAQIATANNVDPQTVITALVTAATTKLNAAVTAGKIKAARAAKIEAKLPAKVAQLVNAWHPKRATTTTT